MNTPDRSTDESRAAQYEAPVRLAGACASHAEFAGSGHARMRVKLLGAAASGLVNLLLWDALAGLFDSASHDRWLAASKEPPARAVTITSSASCAS